MDIKLVKNFENGNYTPINKDLLSQMVDDNYQIDRYNGKKIFIFNPVTNERYDVLPDIRKYDMVKISYAATEHDYIMFTSATRINEKEIKIEYYWYTIHDGASKLVYTQNVELAALDRNVEIKVIVLDENYCIFETISYQEKRSAKLSLFGKGKATYELILHDITADTNHRLENSDIAKSGIEKIIPLNGNMCVIKIGNPMIEEKMYNYNEKRNYDKEIIGVINVKQFISELALNLDHVYMEVLDESAGATTFPYIKQSSNVIVYSKVDVEKKIEEIIMYDYESKIKKVRLNNKISRVSDLSRTFVINNTPYMIKYFEKSTRFINLNTQKTELKLGSDMQVRYIYDDIFVVEKHVKKMFLMRKESNYIVVYRFPDMHHTIFKTRAKYMDCLAHNDELMIFTN